MTANATPDAEETRGTDGEADVDPSALRRAIRDGAEEIERRELRRALGELERAGSLTPEQRRVVAEMAAGVVDGVLAAPESALAGDDRDPEAVRAVADLFGPEG